MPRALRLVLVSLLLITISGCATPSGATPSATPSPTSAPAGSPAPDDEWTDYTSERFGYSLQLPGEWRFRAATEDWPAGEYPTAGAAYIDNFEQPPASFPTVDIATRALVAGETPEAFLEWLDEQNAQICTVVEDGTTEVDGREGRLQRQACGYNVWEVVVFDGEQVYLIYWLGEPSQAPAEQERFRRVIATFRFAGE